MNVFISDSRNLRRGRTRGLKAWATPRPHDGKPSVLTPGMKAWLGGVGAFYGLLGVATHFVMR